VENNVNPTDIQAQRLEGVYVQLDVLLRQPEAVQRVYQPPRDAEWSVLQILGHLIEMIPYWLNACQTLIATTAEPPSFGRSLDAPERLEGVQRGAAAGLDELLKLLHDEVLAALGIIRGMSSADRQKKGIHVRRGEMTVVDIIELFIVVHFEEHLAQVRSSLGI
jgi:uncharacterized damage-inducible protein DinB